MKMVQFCGFLPGVHTRDYSSAIVHIPTKTPFAKNKETQACLQKTDACLVRRSDAVRVWYVL